jgi:hypothetical protein
MSRDVIILNFDLISFFTFFVGMLNLNFVLIVSIIQSALLLYFIKSKDRILDHTINYYGGIDGYLSIYGGPIVLNQEDVGI